jgi:hypothetical protein
VLVWFEMALQRTVDNVNYCIGSSAIKRSFNVFADKICSEKCSVRLKRAKSGSKGGSSRTSAIESLKQKGDSN